MQNHAVEWAVDVLGYQELLRTVMRIKDGSKLFSNGHFMLLQLSPCLTCKLTESNEGDKHKDLRPSEIRRRGKCVQNATEATKGFLNPFDADDRDKVYCLSSRAPVTEK